jgi:hypothetical protein
MVRVTTQCFVVLLLLLASSAARATTITDHGPTPPGGVSFSMTGDPNYGWATLTYTGLDPDAYGDLYFSLIASPRMRTTLGSWLYLTSVTWGSWGPTSGRTAISVSTTPGAISGDGTHPVSTSKTSPELALCSHQEATASLPPWARHGPSRVRASA